MRILELSSGFPTPQNPLVGIFEWDQAKALAAAGHDVVFFAIDTRSIRRKRKFGFYEFTRDGVRVLGYNFYLGRVPIRLSYFVRRVIFKKLYKRIKNSFKPDILHAHFGCVLGDVCVSAKKNFGLNYVITEHDSRLNKDVISNKEREVLKKAYAGAKCNVAVSKAFCDKLSARYDGKFVYVPNVVDTEHFSFSGDGERQYGKFVCVCTLTENKNVGALIRAVEKLNRFGYNCSLDIVGKGEKESELKDLAAELGIYEKVIFHGEKTRGYINNIFKKSSVFALASRSETFGVAYIEAMSAGLPVIATACGGPQGFVSEEVGKLVPVGDDNALFYAMKDMLDNREKYKGEQIREYCTARFSPDSVAEKLIGVFENA